LRLAGYIHVSGTDGDVWFNPGINPVTWILDNRDVLEELLERAASRAAAKKGVTEGADAASFESRQSTSERS
jgi:hypothetical protein